MNRISENHEDAVRRVRQEKQRLIEVAVGQRPAPLVLKNAVYVNVFSNELCSGDIAVCDGVIAGIGTYSGEREVDLSGKIVCPGFIDAHIHLESSLVSPREFVRAVLPHGTTAVVTDPHEIANVLGTDGIEYMLQATEGLPVDVRFMLPSCVPATGFEEAGAELDWRAVDGLYAHPRVLGLAEMMNAFGVTHCDPSVLDKLAAAQVWGRQIDGHAPGLQGGELNAYIAAGVQTDHECSGMAEALEKLRLGQYIMIRDGTAARNLEALAPLLTPQYAARCVFCTDDKHPSDLLEKGHMDYILRQAVSKYGADPILAVKAASFQAAQLFGLKDRGAVAPGYRADLAVVDNLATFRVERVFCGGREWYANGVLQELPTPEVDPELRARAHDTFHVERLTAAHFCDRQLRGVIGMIPGEIVTTDAGRADGIDLGADILKIAVIERHRGTGHIGLGYLHGYGLRRGAVATSISHDSHNLIVVGANDEDMAFAANRTAENGGGITVVADGRILGEVTLKVAGLMSDAELTEVNDALEHAKQAAYALGVNEGVDPFMTLSFMSLPVIPALRLSTRGMVDVATQTYL